MGQHGEHRKPRAEAQGLTSWQFHHGSALCLGFNTGRGVGEGGGGGGGEEEETTVYSYPGNIFSFVFLTVSCQHKIHQTAS